jgi:hypothetical protein
MTPAWLGDRGAVDAGLPAPPAKRRPRPAPGQRLGEEDIVEVLFVITVQP